MCSTIIGTIGSGSCWSVLVTGRFGPGATVKRVREKKRQSCETARSERALFCRLQFAFTEAFVRLIWLASTRAFSSFTRVVQPGLLLRRDLNSRSKGIVVFFLDFQQNFNLKLLTWWLFILRNDGRSRKPLQNAYVLERVTQTGGSTQGVDSEVPE